MAEEYARSRQYEYRANSNLVLEADRESRRRYDEATGEVETLVGKIKHRMGDRYVSSKPADIEERVEKLRKRRSAPDDDEGGEISKKKRKKGKDIFVANAGSTVLSESNELDAFSYKPKTVESRRAYDEILTFVLECIGAQPRDVLRGAAEEVLAIIKDDTFRDNEKQKEVENILNKVKQEKFSYLVGLCKRITDFSSSSGGNDDERDMVEGEEMEEMGVAVVFDEEDEEEESDLDVIPDEDEIGDDEYDNDESKEDELVDKGQIKGGGAGSDDENDDVFQSSLDIKSIDAYWLQRSLSKYYSDADISSKLADDVLEILKSSNELGDCENRLVNLLDYDKFPFIKLLLDNRSKIVYLTLLKQAQTAEERARIEEEMRQDVVNDGPAILEALHKTTSADSWMRDRIGALESSSRKEARNLKKMQQKDQDEMETSIPVNSHQLSYKNLDLDSLAFSQGSHLMSNKECPLPEGTWIARKKGFEEVHVPAIKAKSSDLKNLKLVNISELPEWAQPSFKGMTSLNRVQSKMYDAAFLSDENLLLCAPTGAGKTNVAVLTILHEVEKARKEDGTIDLDSFKIVYVAPMKALVQEVVANLSQRFTGAYGIQVKELSGDQSLTREQIYNTQIIVTTPEKWDIITRKGEDRSYTQLVRLIIFDEIHLLHDERGPVIECLVARTLRQIEATQENVRLVGLSATLPNYEDVAHFLRVDPEKGLFYFDSTYRPVPLQQQYIGITEKKAIKRFQLMNEICYEKVMEQAGVNQVLIFVHSRKETGKTARSLRDLCLENDTLNKFMKESSATSEILQSEASESVKDNELKEILPYGFAIHHAGMPRSDRKLVEELFADKHIQVLCTTSTLAWGVNLPAHTVIIKGTQMYNPEKGSWVELSSLDVMQMLGRAGRPQYDTTGEGIIITSHSELQFYLSLMNQQLPVESQLISKLADNLNAEIVLGTITNLAEASNWLGYTYLYVRMLRAPQLYGVSVEEAKNDKILEQRRLDLIYTAASILAKNGLIKYDRRSGNFQTTPLGQVASYYYIVHKSIATYNEYLKSTMGDIELVRLFSLSYEFRHIVVRSEEKLELAKLMEKVPLPIKESIEEPSAKVNVLLQAYISRLKLDGFALAADMVHISQSAARIFRALFDVALKRGWANVAEKILNLCKMVDRRMWLSHTPLRQFNKVPEVMLRKIEKKDIKWERYLDLSPSDIGQLINYPKMGKQIYQYIHQFPKLELSAHVQPVTRSTLKVELSITPDFEFHQEIHGNSLGFWLLVEDVDGEKIVHYQWFALKRRYATEIHAVSFTVPIYDPLPPQYFIRIVSDRWLHSESSLPISFHHLILPERNPPHTELLDLQPLSISALHQPNYEALYKNFPHFNPIQTQSFSRLYDGDSNVLIAAPASSGKTVCAEFAILRMMKQKWKRCVYIAPKQETCTQRVEEWKNKFAGLQVVELVGESKKDLKLLEIGNLIISTPERWDMLSRRWKKLKNVQNVNLFIVDDLDLIGNGIDGVTMEVVLSRMRYISAQLDSKIRIVGLSGSVANAKDIGDWIGVEPDCLFNFHPNVRPLPIDIQIRGFDMNYFSSRLVAMSKPVYNAVMTNSPSKPVLIFVPSKKQAQITSIDMMTFAVAEDKSLHFLKDADAVVRSSSLIRDEALLHTLQSGVGYLHEETLPSDMKVVLDLYTSGAIQVLVVSKSLAWSIHSVYSFLVVIMGTESYDGREHRYVDYTIADLQQMMSRANRPARDQNSKCAIMCHSPKQEFYKKFLYEPLPVESHLDHYLADHLNAEIVTKTIENKQDAVDYLTWTFLYRRLSKNPNYYNIQGSSHRHLSDHLSELIETTASLLEETACIQVEDEMNLVPLNLGMISSHYCIKYTTIELFANSLKAKTKLKGLLEILSSSSEFMDLPIRHQEDMLLKRIAKHLTLPIETPNYNDPHTKANILLQTYFSRTLIPRSLVKDQKFVITHSIRLLQGIVDVASSNGWLKPALAAMDLCKMVVQGLWESQSGLYQIPHFTEEIVKKLQAHDDAIESPTDILNMEDDDRNSILALNPHQMSSVARFCNRFPDINMEFTIKNSEEIYAGGNVELVVELQRELDDEDDEGGMDDFDLVSSSTYPKEKQEEWWLIVGDVKANTCLNIKRISIGKKNKVKLDFTAPEQAGEYAFQLYLVCDSYLGCDQENQLDINVLENQEEDEPVDMEEE